MAQWPSKQLHAHNEFSMHQLIEQQAYRLYLLRGKVDGYDKIDWAKACHAWNRYFAIRLWRSWGSPDGVKVETWVHAERQMWIALLADRWWDDAGRPEGMPHKFWALATEAVGHWMAPPGWGYSEAA